MTTTSTYRTDMKRVLAILLVASLAATGAVAAQPSPGITPENPLWGVERSFERVSVGWERLTGTPSSVAELQVDHALERTAEINAVQETNESYNDTKNPIMRALRSRNRSLERAESIAANLTDGDEARRVTDRISEAHQVHVEVLRQVKKKVPIEAKAAIERNIERSMERQEQFNEKKSRVVDRARRREPQGKPGSPGSPGGQP